MHKESTSSVIRKHNNQDVQNYLSFWHVADIPVGMWTILTALSVVLACCPPAPPERNLSIRRSDSFILYWEDRSPRIGITATAEKDVWRRFALSKGEIRTSLWTPISALAYPNAYSPSTFIVALCEEKIDIIY